MKLDISLIESGLTPLPNNVESQNWAGHAAILVPLVDEDSQSSLLLTRRAIEMTHHGGEVAFPGGMWEPGDYFPHRTALREAEEEVALNPDKVRVLGTLPPVPARSGTLVTPVVGVISPNISLIASPAEIDSIFYVPLVELLSDRRIRTDMFARRGDNVWAPAYQYHGYEIWGLTAGVIKTLLEQCFAIDFPRNHYAPEKIW